MEEGQKELTAELYRLYWDSDRSVRQIREELDITSAALYQLLDPLPVDAACHVCGGTVGLKNRTARTNREGVCLRCGEVVRLPGEEAEGKARREGEAESKGQARREAEAESKGQARREAGAESKGQARREAGDAKDDAAARRGQAAGSDNASARADGAPPKSDPDWVSGAVDDALESTERAVRDVLFVAVGLVAVLAVGVVGLLRRRG